MEMIGCWFWITIIENFKHMIRRYLFFLFFPVLMFSCQDKQEVYMFSTFREPATEGLYLAYSLDGYQWNDLGGPYLVPEVGNQKVMRDPSVVKGPDGTFHMVWTSSWQGDSGFGYASSKDLVHWSDQKFIPVMAHEPATVNVWAPELFYDDESGQYIIIWASTIPFRFEKGMEEERNNHRMYYTTTKDFETFSETKLFIDPGFSIIDAVIVKRDQNDYVLVLKDNTRPNRNLKVAFGFSPLGPYSNISEPFTVQFTEGPTVLRIKDEYLIYFDAYRSKNYGAVRTRDFKTFEDISDSISLPEGHKHGTIFKADMKILKAIQKGKEAQEQKLDTIRYTGHTLNNVDYHHGQLSNAVGVHNIQVLRANREQPEFAENYGWTYNHAPMLAYWNNTFYLQYLSDPVGEHIPPGQTFLSTSEDGYAWSRPVPLFPPYKIPDGTTKEGEEGAAKDLYAVMHQRNGFYVFEASRLLTFGYYGISLHERDSPNDGKGIGRVVREIYRDGTFGPIYFIRYNKGWNAGNTDYPFFRESRDTGFVKACMEVLDNPLMMQQWNEESDRDDPLIPMNEEYKAFCYYHLPDGRVVGLWKHALTAMSLDEGKNWTKPIRAPGFVNSNAKIWGQRTSDGRYATVYNPSDFRWPLAISVSEDGLEYRNLLLVNGEITTMRYGGNYKSYGPQYVRGILEGNGTPPDGNLWVTYSMNKEDIWVSSIAVPVTDTIIQHVDEVFEEMKEGTELDSWNIYSPQWARVEMTEDTDGSRALLVSDRDPFDYAKAERKFPGSKAVEVEFVVSPAQNDHGLLHVELQDRKGMPALRLIFDSDGRMKHKAGYRFRNIMNYDPDREYKIKIEAWTHNRFYNIYVDGEQKTSGLFFQPVHYLDKITFRSGEIRRFPDADTPTDQKFDIRQNGPPVQEARYFIKYLKTRTIE